jgi:hypothetical protein
VGPEGPDADVEKRYRFEEIGAERTRADQRARGVSAGSSVQTEPGIFPKLLIKALIKEMTDGLVESVTEPLAEGNLRRGARSVHLADVDAGRAHSDP